MWVIPLLRLGPHLNTSSFLSGGQGELQDTISILWRGFARHRMKRPEKSKLILLKALPIEMMIN